MKSEKYELSEGQERKLVEKLSELWSELIVTHDKRGQDRMRERIETVEFRALASGIVRDTVATIREAFKETLYHHGRRLTDRGDDGVRVPGYPPGDVP